METSIGSSELRLLRYIAENGPITVRAAHEGYGEPLGLVRTTTQQMMERLRKKGLLVRTDSSDGFLYIATEKPDAVERSAIHTFVNQALGGSLTPLVSYLVEQQKLSEADQKELAELLEQLRGNE